MLRAMTLRWPGRLHRLALHRELEAAMKDDGKALEKLTPRRGFTGHSHAPAAWTWHCDRPGLLHKGRHRSLFRVLEDEMQKMRGLWEDQLPFASRTGFAAADLQETEKAFIVKLDLPGLSKKDIKVQVGRDRVLTVRGQRESAGTSELSSGFQRSERHLGTFERKFQLPEAANIEGITAKAEEGVLSIEVQKLEPTAAGMTEVQIA